MSWRRYDPEGMKKAGTDIGNELVSFTNAMNRMDQAVGSVKSINNDPTITRFYNKYHSQVKPAMEEAKQSMESYAALLKEAGKRYGNMIDNGNSNLLL